jgi:hypothetical protein
MPQPPHARLSKGERDPVSALSPTPTPTFPLARAAIRSTASRRRARPPLRVAVVSEPILSLFFHSVSFALLPASSPCLHFPKWSPLGTFSRAPASPLHGRPWRVPHRASSGREMHLIEIAFVSSLSRCSRFVEPSPVVPVWVTPASPLSPAMARTPRGPLRGRDLFRGEPAFFAASSRWFQWSIWWPVGPVSPTPASSPPSVMAAPPRACLLR